MMNHLLKNGMNWLMRLLLILVSSFLFQSCLVPVIASPITFDKDHHTNISVVYTYDETEISVWTEVGCTGGLSRVLLKDRGGSDGKF